MDESASEKQALTDRDAGTLLLRDAGSPSDTRWIDDREDLPRIIRAGRHIARTKRYLRNYAHEIEPGDLAAYVRREARRRRRLGQARRGLDRPRRGRPRPELAALGPGRGHRRRARGGRPGHRALLRRELPARPRRGRHRLRRARHGADRGDHPALRGTRRRDRPHPRQHGDVPPTRGRRHEVPALVRPHEAAVRAPLRDRARRPRRGHPRLRRHGRGRFPPARAGLRGGGRVDDGRPPRRRTRSRPPSGARANGWAVRAWRRALRPTSWSTRRTRAPTCVCWRHPQRIVLRGRGAAR